MEWTHTGRYAMDPGNLREYGGHDVLNLHASGTVRQGVELFGRVLPLEGLLRILAVSGLIGFATNWHSTTRVRVALRTPEYDSTGDADPCVHSPACEHPHAPSGTPCAPRHSRHSCW